MDLPEDVHRTVIAHVDHSDLHSLCLLNRTFDDIVSPILLRRLYIPWKKYYSHKSDAYSFELFSTGRLPRYARELKFSGYFWTLEKPYEPTFPATFNCLLEIVSTFSSLIALELEWRYHWKRTGHLEEETNNMLCRVAAAVMTATHGRLKKLLLHTDSNYMHFPTPLHTVNGLEYFQYAQDQRGRECERRKRRLCDPNCHQLPTILPIIFKNNPDISTLEIFSGCLGTGKGSENYLSPNLAKLRTLTLAGMSLQELSTDSRLPFAPLRSLRHLFIKNVYSEYNLDLLWISLRGARTKLVSLESGQISSSLVDYLSSFSGLESLIIRGIEGLPQCIQGADSFFDATLPRHGSTLKILEFSYARGVEDVPQWAFHPDRWAGALEHLHVLEELRLHVSSMTLPADILLELSHNYAEQDLNVQKLRFVYQKLLDRLFPDGTDGIAKSPSSPVSRALLPNLRRLVVCRPFFVLPPDSAKRHYIEERRLFWRSVVPVLRCRRPLEDFCIRLHNHETFINFRQILETDVVAKKMAREKLDERVGVVGWYDSGDEKVDESMKQWFDGQFMFVPEVA